MFLRPVRTSQPQGPARVDWSNPITRGLAIAQTPFDLGSRTIPKTIGIKGVGSTFPSAASAGVLLNQQSKVTSLMSANVGTTYLAFANPSASGGASIISGVYPAGQYGYYPQFNRSKVDGFATGGVFSFSASDGNRGSDAAGVVDGRVHAFVAVLKNAAGGLAQIFVDGVDKTTDSTATGGVVASNASDYHAGFSGGGFGVNGYQLYLSCWWNRALSNAEIKSLSANPWQIFAPDSKALWIPAAATVSLPTLVQPSSTTSAGAWTATGAATLHDAINEAVASDTQYISVNSASTTELVLAESAHPGAANQTLAYRASSTQGSTLTVTLKQGVTTIMTRTHSLTGIDTLYTQTLTSGEIALITAGAISVTLTTS